MFRTFLLLLCCLGVMVPHISANHMRGRGRQPQRGQRTGHSSSDSFTREQRRLRARGCIYEDPESVDCDQTFQARIMMLIIGDDDCPAYLTLPCLTVADLADMSMFLAEETWGGMFMDPFLGSRTASQASVSQSRPWNPVSQESNFLSGSTGFIGLVPTRETSRSNPPARESEPSTFFNDDDDIIADLFSAILEDPDAGIQLPTQGRSSSVTSPQDSLPIINAPTPNRSISPFVPTNVIEPATVENIIPLTQTFQSNRPSAQRQRANGVDSRGRTPSAGNNDANDDNISDMTQKGVDSRGRTLSAGNNDADDDNISDMTQKGVDSRGRTPSAGNNDANDDNISDMTQKGVDSRGRTPSAGNNDANDDNISDMTQKGVDSRGRTPSAGNNDANDDNISDLTQKGSTSSEDAIMEEEIQVTKTEGSTKQNLDDKSAAADTTTNEIDVKFKDTHTAKMTNVDEETRTTDVNSNEINTTDQSRSADDNTDENNNNDEAIAPFSTTDEGTTSSSITVNKITNNEAKEDRRPPSSLDTFKRFWSSAQYSHKKQKTSMRLEN